MGKGKRGCAVSMYTLVFSSFLLVLIPSVAFSQKVASRALALTHLVSNIQTFQGILCFTCKCFKFRRIRLCRTSAGADL